MKVEDIKVGDELYYDPSLQWRRGTFACKALIVEVDGGVVTAELYSPRLDGGWKIDGTFSVSPAALRGRYEDVVADVQKAKDERRAKELAAQEAGQKIIVKASELCAIANRAGFKAQNITGRDGRSVKIVMGLDTFEALLSAAQLTDDSHE